MSVAPEPPASTGRSRRPVRRVGLALVIIVLAIPLFFLDWIAVRDWIGYRDRVEYLGLEIRIQRASWFPGPEVRIPPQLCPECRAGRPETCASRVGAMLLYGGPGATDAYPGTFRISTSPDIDPRLSTAAHQIVCTELGIGSVAITPESFDCADDPEE